MEGRPKADKAFIQWAMEHAGLLETSDIVRLCGITLDAYGGVMQREQKERTKRTWFRVTAGVTFAVLFSLFLAIAGHAIHEDFQSPPQREKCNRDK